MILQREKGLSLIHILRLSQVIAQEIPHNPIVILSGPSHAEEIARNVPTTIVAASAHRESAEYVQDVLMNTNLRVYVNDDLTGVELGGALKNIIALCAGICDGMELGDNAKAALMTRGLAEIARLGLAMGAEPETFTGLTGMGDLIVTCTSMHSRNRRCGIFIGQGLSLIHIYQSGFLAASRKRCVVPARQPVCSILFCASHSPSKHRLTEKPGNSHSTIFANQTSAAVSKNRIGAYASSFCKMEKPASASFCAA